MELLRVGVKSSALGKVKKRSFKEWGYVGKREPMELYLEGHGKFEERMIDFTTGVHVSSGVCAVVLSSSARSISVKST